MVSSKVLSAMAKFEAASSHGKNSANERDLCPMSIEYQARVRASMRQKSSNKDPLNKTYHTPRSTLQSKRTHRNDSLAKAQSEHTPVAPPLSPTPTRWATGTSLQDATLSPPIKQESDKSIATLDTSASGGGLAAKMLSSWHYDDTTVSESTVSTYASDEGPVVSSPGRWVGRNLPVQEYERVGENGLSALSREREDEAIELEEDDTIVDDDVEVLADSSVDELDAKDSAQAAESKAYSPRRLLPTYSDQAKALSQTRQQKQPIALPTGTSLKDRLRALQLH